MNLYPLKFKPIFKERIWGGRRLESVFHKPLPPNVAIGESWELADLPEDKSQIVNGPLKGKTIDHAIELFGEELTGKADYMPPFPLLIKILDAEDVLSVQVHPDAETCRRRGKGDPKTECWYIIEAREGAVIYKGLKPGTTREDFARAIEEGNTADMLNKVPVRQGECHFLPSGTAHAIGEGLLIAEIQQPSDTTYRVFDWNRVDPGTGKGRQLHVEDALESIHFDSSEDNLSVRTSGRLADADEFKVEKVEIEAGGEYNFGLGEVRALVTVEGAGHIVSPRADRVDIAKGDTVLLPAGFGGRIRAATACEILVSTI